MPPVNSVDLDNLKNMQRAVNEFCKTIGDYKLGLLVPNEIQTESDLHKKMGDLVEIINKFQQKIMHTELRTYISMYVHRRGLPTSQPSHISPTLYRSGNDDESVGWTDDESIEDDPYDTSTSTPESTIGDQFENDIAALLARYAALPQHSAAEAASEADVESVSSVIGGHRRKRKTRKRKTKKRKTKKRLKRKRRK